MSALNRRGFLAGIVGLIAAPAIVRASSLMPIKALKPEMMVVDIEAGPLGWITVNGKAYAIKSVDNDIINIREKIADLYTTPRGNWSFDLSPMKVHPSVEPLIRYTDPMWDTYHDLPTMNLRMQRE